MECRHLVVLQLLLLPGGSHLEPQAGMALDGSHVDQHLDLLLAAAQSARRYRYDRLVHVGQFPRPLPPAEVPQGGSEHHRQ